jgi:MSHA type pilus biogenesis protein MshL
MTAGLIQVTDRPSALKRVQGYLKELTESVARQVDIEAKIYDVALNDQSQFGIDWTKIIQSGAGQFALGGFPTVTAPSGDFSLKEDTFKFSFTDKTSSVVLRALQEQGEVSVVSQPRLRTLNNQTAIMKVGRDEPFFTEYSQSVASGAAQTSYSGDILSVITVGTVLTITPQVSTNGWITLDISPAITSLVDTRTSPSRQSSAPVLDIKQTSTIVRVRDNETIVMGGLIQNSEARTIRKTPLISDIPGLGKLFQGRFHAHKKSELVIFLTPRVVR